MELVKYMSYFIITMQEASVLQKILAGTLAGSTQSIKAAEQALLQVERDPSFIIQLLRAVRQPTSPGNVRKAAVAYTRVYARKMMSEKNQQMISLITQGLLECLSTRELEIEYKRMLADTLQYLLLQDTHAIRADISNLCIKFLQEAKEMPDSAIEFEFIGLVVNALLASEPKVSQLGNLFMQATFLPFLQLYSRLFKLATAVLATENTPQTLQILTVVRLFSLSLRNYLKRIHSSRCTQLSPSLFSDSLTSLLTSVLTTTPPYNTLSTPIIYRNPQASPQLSQLVNQIKADSIRALYYIMRVIFTQFKDAKMVAAHEILSNDVMMAAVVGAVGQLLAVCPLRGIKSPVEVELMEQLLYLCTLAAQNPYFYSIFHSKKQEIIQGCVMRLLEWSRQDYGTLVEEPEQFYNYLLQVVDVEILPHPGEPAQDREQSLELHHNLKTLAAAYLYIYAKFIDGSLAEILAVCMRVLGGREQAGNELINMLMVLGVLTKQLVAREQQTKAVVGLLCGQLGSRELPPGDQGHQGPLLQYLMLMVVVEGLLREQAEVTNQQLSALCGIVYGIITNNNAPGVLQHACIDLCLSICQAQPAFTVNFIQLLNQTLPRSPHNWVVQHLKLMGDLFKMGQNQLRTRLPLVAQTVRVLCGLVLAEMSKKAGLNQLVINNSWNVISDICEKDAYVPQLVGEIEEAVLPLVPFIDGVTNYDYEENILMLMSSFISRTKKVTAAELLMIDIMPRLFYMQYKYRFGHAFETLHIFIHHGSEILASAPQALQTLIDMAIKSVVTTQLQGHARSEAENCEGVLLLQSIVLSCGNSFTAETWVQITQALTQRLQVAPVRTYILKSNILAALLAILMVGHGCFIEGDCTQLLQKVINQVDIFKVEYSINLAIACFTELLGMLNRKFVINNFVAILQAALALLHRKQSSQLDDPHDPPQDNRDYQISTSVIINKVTEMNLVQHFRNKINTLRGQNEQILQQAYQMLPQSSAAYLQKVMSSAKVMNEDRQIFKIKR